MKRVSDLGALVEAMQTLRFGIADQLSYRIPVGLWLLGDTEQASAFLASKVADCFNRSDPAAERYKAFAAALSDQV